MIGQTISQYRILEQLGGGGMGLVYRAHDTRLDRSVALKFLPKGWSQDKEFRERFDREARAASALDHPHICTVYEINETDEGQLFIAMAHCPGETLKERIRRGQMPIDEAVSYAIQIADALGTAHENGIVHRDIKPANILISDREQVKIVDFGLAKLAGEAAVTRDGTVVGTPAYMSPEQTTCGEVDGRADLWALGVVLYEMITGRRAFTGDHEQAILLSIASSDPTPVETLRPDVPAELVRILNHCLKRDPNHRYQSARELEADLRQFRGESAVPIPTLTRTLISAVKPKPKHFLLHRFLPAAAAVAVVVLAAMIYPIINAPQQRHLAILPFQCIGAADEQSENLCKGLLETITAKLADMQRFRSSISVVPASEVRFQKVSSADQARRIFGVDLVVSGSILHENGSLRIPLELVDTAKLRQLDSKTLTSELTTDFVLQDRIVEMLREMLDVEIGPEERQALQAGGTNNAKAAQLFLEARGRVAAAVSEDELAAAMNLYRQALDLDPNFADALVQLSDACYQRFRHTRDSIWLEHGTGYAQRAVEVAPNLPTAHLAAGRFAVYTGSHQAAVEHLQRTLVLDPLNIHAYMYLGDSYKATGDFKQAEETLERAVRTGPEDWGTHLMLGRLHFERGELESAANYFRRIIELLPDSSIGYTSLGGCYIYLGDLKIARNNLEKAVEIGAGYWAYSNLATVEYWEGNFQRAAELYQQALDMNASDYLIWNNLGEALRQQAKPDFKGALTAYRRAVDLVAKRIEIKPDDPKLLIDLASYRVQLGDEPAARDLLPSILTLDITNSKHMFDLAALYEELGERDDATEWLGRALEAGYPLSIIENYPDFADLVQDSNFSVIAKRFNESAAATIADESAR